MHILILASKFNFTELEKSGDITNFLASVAKLIYCN